MEIYVPTSEELAKAHELFQTKEPRWGDYGRAVEDVENGLRQGNVSDAAAAIADFLSSWNWEYYRHIPASLRAAKLGDLQTELQQLITEDLPAIEGFRARSLASLTLADRPAVLALFNAFERILRPVGTAKALAVLAPAFFPLWDNAIAFGYGVLAGPRGYFLFMVLVKYQASSITLPEGLAPLKVLDEYNYGKYTKGWLP